MPHALEQGQELSVALVGLGQLVQPVEFGSDGKRQRRLGCPRARIAFVFDTVAFVAQLASAECAEGVVAVDDRVVRGVAPLVVAAAASSVPPELEPWPVLVVDACLDSS